MFLVYACRFNSGVIENTSIEVEPYEYLKVFETENEVRSYITQLAEDDANRFVKEFDSQLWNINSTDYYTKNFMCSSLIITNEINFATIFNMVQKYSKLYLEVFDGVVGVAHYKAKADYIEKEKADRDKRAKQSLQTLYSKYSHLSIFEKEIKEFYGE